MSSWTLVFNDNANTDLEPNCYLIYKFMHMHFVMLSCIVVEILQGVHYDNARGIYHI